MRTAWTLPLILLLALAPAGVAKDDDSDDERDDGRFDEVGREVKVSVSGLQAQVRMERKGGGVEDEVKVQVEGGEDAHLRIAYETENATMKTETDLKVKLREVVEFADDDSDGAYDPDADRLVARHPVGSLRWSVGMPTDVASAEGVAGKRIVTTGAFPQGGSLGLVLFVYGDFATLNGTSLRPTDAKLDILLDRFPYAENGTAAALLVKTEWKAGSKAENERRDGDDEDVRGVAAGSEGVRAYFTWADVALVDGVEKPVRTTVVSTHAKEEPGETKAKDTFWFAYPRGGLVNHDPVLGVQGADARPVEKGVPGFAPALAMVAAAAVALGARRRS